MSEIVTRLPVEPSTPRERTTPSTVGQGKPTSGSGEAHRHLTHLERPRFFCGMVLTDSDLNDLAGWASAKARLSRYRHGWGVVCGLDVTCDASNPAGVVITPGYALSSCGDDIIVCRPAELDLSGACPKEEDPCAHPDQPEPTAGQRAQLITVDVVIAYTEQLDDPQSVSHSRGCGDGSGCEYGKTRETYQLGWLVEPTADPTAQEAQRWQEGYDRCAEVVKQFKDHFGAWEGEGKDEQWAKRVRDWLIDWIDMQGLQYLCLLRRHLCSIPLNDLQNQPVVVRVLFEIVQECRNHYLRQDCELRTVEAGVPLARVWLRSQPSQGSGAPGPTCQVELIDPYPPFRRPIRPSVPPLKRDHFSVGQFIWRRWPFVCANIAGIGLTVTKRPFEFPQTVDQLAEKLKPEDNPLFMPCGSSCSVETYLDDAYQEEAAGVKAPGERVVRFLATAGNEEHDT